MIYVCNVPGLKKWDEPQQINNILEDLEEYKDKIVGLELCHNSIGEKCAEALGERIKQLKYLMMIDLSDCFVSRGSEELPKCLKYILEALEGKNIKQIKINDNALGPTAAPGYEFFFQKNKTLEKLFINNCGMGPVGTPRLMKIISENKDMPLKVLQFSRNKIENIGCNSISEMIKNKKDIQEISISDNEIHKEGLELFFNTIKNNQHISSIDVHNNILGKEVKQLPEIISSLSNIKYLDLSDLTIENSSIIKEIFENLPKLSKLREFHFDFNISDLDFKDDKEKTEFISKLFECLLKLDNIKGVKMENNDIPKALYKENLPKFKNKGLYLFSCYNEEEKMEDEEGEDMDMTDLNK